MCQLTIIRTTTAPAQVTTPAPHIMGQVTTPPNIIIVQAPLYDPVAPGIFAGTRSADRVSFAPPTTIVASKLRALLVSFLRLNSSSRAITAGVDAVDKALQFAHKHVLFD
ncbi:hypothetical protein H072_6314 [Dactylellina haptotyla CBS 200.50]|uniref:Uncharacterized protein n=1 Tax=Dactylellina haptotyla (strain CBS 200.50) TaxID=1284197 RepID=S8A9W3_DACHA|nr:hypothetical protein H072_6314 [Dactylellina haptotyla CBS 200.50]